MGDQFVLLVDHLLTDPMLGAATESRNQAQMMIVPISDDDQEADATPWIWNKSGVPAGKLVECRICHDEDQTSNMETPCSCCGSLKYAHRDCVQRWCNEKGDTMCEICLQQFNPGYTAPPELFQFGRTPMNFRENWEISRRDTRFLTMVPTDRDFDGTNDNDYSTSNVRSILYCRSVAIIFTVLLVLRHALPIIISGVENYSFTISTLLPASIFLPLYIMLRVVTRFRPRHHQQEPQVSSTSASASEVENLRVQSLEGIRPQPRFYRAH